MPQIMSHEIKGAVGATPGAVNFRADVETVQRLLNAHTRRGGYAAVAVNGVVSPLLILAIKAFQQKVVGMPMPDGRVDPGGATLRKLNDPAAPAAPSFNPAGKSFQERLTAFLADAKAVYHVTIRAGTELRRPEDAQRWHVAHMIYYNSFAWRKPEHHELWEGDHVIAWSHLEDAATAWEHLNWADFLRDAKGQVPVREGDGWAKGKEPDRDRTRQRALEVLKAAGIAKAKNRPNDPHSAMVAPGYQGCASPCKCGGSRSNHIAGEASDLGQAQLDTLKQKLHETGAGTLDQYLKRFGLHRPMATEPWHVEAKG
jgi:hypothetical protein